MASRKNTKNKKNKDQKLGLGKRIKRFFTDIKSELKRVTWPDKKKLKANTGTVIAIIMISMAMIFVFDTVISSLLSATGFYSYDNQADTAITEDIEETETIEEAAETSKTEDSESSE